MDVIYLAVAVVVAYTFGFFLGRWAYIKYGDHSLIHDQQTNNPQANTTGHTPKRKGYHGGVKAKG